MQNDPERNQYLNRAEKEVNDAAAARDTASNLQSKGEVEKAAAAYFDAGEQMRLASVHFEAARMMGSLTKHSTPKLLDKELEALEKSGDDFENAARLWTSRNDIVAVEMWGRAVHNYNRILSLKQVTRMPTSSISNLGPFRVQGIPGKAIDCYEKASILLHDIGIQHRNKGDYTEARLTLGEMADAYASLALMYQEFAPAVFADEFASENYMASAQGYAESGAMAEKLTLSSVATTVRPEWDYAFPRLMSLFKDPRGYAISNESQRAVVMYRAAQEAAKRRGDKALYAKAARRLMSLAAVLNSPEDAVKACQDICDSTSEIIVLPINLAGRQLRNSDVVLLREISQTWLTNPKDAVYKILEELEPRLRALVKDRLSNRSPRQWFARRVVAKLEKNDIEIMIRNYRKETGNGKKEFFKENNPLDYANIEHLEKIIRSPVNWPLFRKDFGTQEDFEIHIKPIVRFRHPIMHIRGHEKNFELVATCGIWLLSHSGP